MIIISTIDYKAHIEAITKETDLLFPSVSNNMDSDEMNLIFNNIKSSLDTLYEKTRLLDNVYDYLNTYLYNKFNTNIEHIQYLTNVLDNYQEYENKDYEVYTVGLFNNQTTITDRDGSLINKCTCKNSLSIPIMVNEVIPDIVTKTSNEICYSDNINTCVDNKQYKAFYSILEPRQIEEELVFTFNEPVDTNYIKIEPFACDINSIKVNDQEVNDTMLIPMSKDVSTIKVQIKSNAYQKSTSNVVNANIDNTMSFNSYEGSTYTTITEMVNKT